MGALGDPLEEMKDLDDAESREFRELTANKSGPCLARCNRIPEETRAAYAELGVLESARAPSHRGPGTDRIGRMRFRRPRVSVNVDSSRTEAELPSEDAIQGEIAWAWPNSNQSSESTRGRNSDESHRREPLDLSILRPKRIPFASAAAPVAHTDGPWYRSRRVNTTESRTSHNSGTGSRLCSGRNS